MAQVKQGSQQAGLILQPPVRPPLSSPHVRRRLADRGSERRRRRRRHDLSAPYTFSAGRYTCRPIDGRCAPNSDWVGSFMHLTRWLDPSEEKYGSRATLAPLKRPAVFSSRADWISKRHTKDDSVRKRNPDKKLGLSSTSGQLQPIIFLDRN